MRRSGVLRCFALLVCAAGLATLGAAVARPALAVAEPPQTGRFIARPPTRVVDSRLGLGASGPMGPGTTIVVDMTPVVPAGSLAVAFNLTVTSPERPGWVTAWPAGSDKPLASNINVNCTCATRANFVTLALPADRRVSLYNHAGGQVVIDVVGYWLAAVASGGGRFVAADPTRVLDTRGVLGGHPGKVPAGETMRLPVAGGPAGVPMGAVAVVATVTAHDVANAGWVTTWGSGTRPEASTVNFIAAGETVPNLAVIPLAEDGSISLFTTTNAHLIVDVTGWFTAETAEPSGDGLFVAVKPARIADSRTALGVDRLARGLYDELLIGGAAPVPVEGVSAVALNLTVTDPYDAGWLTAYPGRTPAPPTSNLNFKGYDDVGGLAVVAMGGNGTVSLFSPVGTHVVVDVAGWFTGAAKSVVAAMAAPRHCRDLMAYLHRDDPNAARYGARIRDLSGATTETIVNVPGGLSVGALRWAPNCEFLVVAVVASVEPPRYDFLRFDDPGSGLAPLRIASNRPWRGLAVSTDARFIYYYGGTSEALGDMVDTYDNLVGATKTVLYRMPPRTFGLMAGASEANDALYLTASDGLTSALRLYRCSAGTCSVVADHAAGAADVTIRQDVPGGSRYAFVDAAGAVVEFGANSRKALHPGAVQIRLTWQGDAVTSARPDNAQPGVWRFDLDPTGNVLRQAKLLDNILDGAPAFSRPWAPANPL